MLLATFINVLWSLSSSFAFHVAGRAIAIPGYMVWAAVVYSGSASLLSYWVGKSLIGRNAEPLRARGGSALLAGAGERAHRLDRARRRRAGRGAAHRARPAERARGHAPAGHRQHQPHLGDGGLRLVHPGRADPGRRTAVLRRRPVLRRPHDGLGRLHAGAVLAALVRRQFQHARRLARDAAAGGELPPGADRLRCACTKSRAASSTPRASRADRHPRRPRDLLARRGPPGSPSRTSRSSPASACSWSARPGPARRCSSGRSAGLWPWGVGTHRAPRGRDRRCICRGRSYLPPGTLREVLAYPSDRRRASTSDACVKALERLGLERLVAHAR